MKKNGFTLIELLAVIALLGILIVIAVPSYTKLSSKTKDNLLKEKIESIESAASLYAKDREEDLRGGDVIQGQIDDNDAVSTSTEEAQPLGETYICPRSLNGKNNNDDPTNPTTTSSEWVCKCPSSCPYPFVHTVRVWYLLEANYIDNEGKCSDTPADASTTLIGGVQVNNGLGRREYCNPRNNKSMRNVKVVLTRKELASGKISYYAKVDESTIDNS